MDYSNQLAKAVEHFWKVRTQQQTKQDNLSGVKDYGTRGAVTGGKHLDGFIEVVKEILSESGLPDSSIHIEKTTLPGYFRPTKDWDLVVVVDDKLLASIEFKAQVGSFGNNYNNRVEEALGSATDLLTAYREGKFQPSQKPWLGWLMLLEDSKKSTVPVKVKEPHFKVFQEFRNVSYAQRYELFCERLVREQLYDAACLLMSNEVMGLQGGYSEPNLELGFNPFVTSLMGRAIAHAKMRE